MEAKWTSFLALVCVGSFAWLCIAASNLFPPPGGGGGGGAAVAPYEIWTNDLSFVRRTPTNESVPILLYTTNNVTGLGLTFGIEQDTNLSANITITGFSMGPTYYETGILSCTNSSGSDWKVTFPAGVMGPPGNGAPPSFFVTNKTSADIYFSHLGHIRTNAWKIDWAP